MDTIVFLFLGIVIGIIVTYIPLQKEHKRKIVKLQRMLRAQGVEFKEEKNKSNTQKPLFNPDNSEIKNFLTSRKITIKNIPSANEYDQVLENVALFMGSRYGLIKKFYTRIKSNMNSGRAFVINLKNDSQEKISSICQLGSQLYQIAFLEEYYYQRAPKYILYAKTSRSSKALNFLSGQWLERYLKAKIVQIIEETNPDLKYSYLVNPQVILPNGNDFELDIIFKIENEFFWFEAKTGDYQRHIEKYSRISSMLNLDKAHSYMVLTDIPDQSIEALSSLFTMTIVKVENFSDYFRKSLSKWSKVEE